MINPTSSTTSGSQDLNDEGCLSVPGPYAELARASVATVRGVDTTGAPVEVTGTGFFARCLQHETDHLRGLLYIDHLPRNRRRRVLRTWSRSSGTRPRPDLGPTSLAWALPDGPPLVEQRAPPIGQGTSECRFNLFEGAPRCHVASDAAHVRACGRPLPCSASSRQP